MEKLVKTYIIKVYEYQEERVHDILAKIIKQHITQ